MEGLSNFKDKLVKIIIHKINLSIHNNIFKIINFNSNFKISKVKDHNNNNRNRHLNSNFSNRNNKQGLINSKIITSKDNINHNHNHNHHHNNNSLNNSNNNLVIIMVEILEGL